MYKQEIYAQLRALNQESERRFDVYQESGIYTLLVDTGNSSFSPICVGMTGKECAKAIETMRGYFSKVVQVWLLQEVCGSKRTTIGRLCSTKELAMSCIEILKSFSQGKEFKNC